ncbi:MAG: adenylate/guanylate cyclase domain-containing protein [Candidatus Limnocylindria bacterium]
MPELPTGTVAFLFSDIEGSTLLLQQLGDRWPAVLERHRTLVRDVVAQHEGREVGTEGDSFFIVFGSAPAAMAAAADIQRALAAEAWPEGADLRVRMGLHVGEGVIHGGTYVGLDVHRAARVADAAHGGQTLLSDVAAALVRSSLPPDASVRDLGEHRLKDLSRPERLWQLTIEGLATSFPPLRTLDAVPNNLPTQLTSFLGRDRELAEIRALVGETRLLTLTGPGGTGKTRLALQLAAELSGSFDHGVFWVALDTIGDPALVPATIAQAIGMTDVGANAVERLAEHLARRRMLLVLDNFEQVVDAGPALADLLRRAPGLVALVTSRFALRVSGEHEYPVPPLELPDLRRATDAVQLSQYAAVALFIERAISVKPDFAVTNDNAPAVAEICVRLDGLPLALELAAARIRILAPDEILRRLDDRLGLLTSGLRDLPERQRTLRGAIAWSHELLDPDERSLLAQLAVFSGGARLDAVEAVIGGDALTLVDRIEALTEKSFLRREDEPSGRERYRMLETIREFALEQLVAAGEEADLRRRHAAHYLAFAEAGAELVLGPERGRCLDDFELEHDNLRAALAWAVESGEAEIALRLVAACWRFWQVRGYLPEAKERASRALELPHDDSLASARLKALEAAGGIAYWMGDFRLAAVHYGGALDIARRLGDARQEAEQLYNLGFTTDFRRLEERAAAQDYAEIALERFRTLGDRHGEGRALWALSNSMLYMRDDPQAQARGRAAGEEALVIFRELDDRFMTSWAIFMQAGYAEGAGDRARARALLLESLQFFSEINDVSGYGLVFDFLAANEFAMGNRELAMRLAGAATAIQATSGNGLAELNRDAEGFFPDILAASDSELAVAYEEGKRLEPAQAVALARSTAEAVAT